jgi:uncharacterized protein
VSAFFFDSSALVKRYVVENGTPWVQGVLDPHAGHRVYIARVALVEVVSAVSRRARGGSIPAEQAAAILAALRRDSELQYRVVEVTPAIFRRAEILAERHALRGYDAIQLAVAALVHDLRFTLGATSLTVVSADLELNTAAAADGLQVEDPNQQDATG